MEAEFYEMLKSLKELVVDSISLCKHDGFNCADVFYNIPNTNKSVRIVIYDDDEIEFWWEGTEREVFPNIESKIIDILPYWYTVNYKPKEYDDIDFPHEIDGFY